MVTSFFFWVAGGDELRVFLWTSLSEKRRVCGFGDGGFVLGKGANGASRYLIVVGREDRRERRER